MVELNFFINRSEVPGDVRVSQGSFLVPSDNHASGLDAAAIDLALPAGTDIFPFFEGRVVGAYSDYSDDAFPTAPETGPATFSNFVTVEYEPPSFSGSFFVTYAHLSQETAEAWVNRLASAAGSVDISLGERIGEVAGPSDTQYPIHLHLSFATDLGFPNPLYEPQSAIALAWDAPVNERLLNELTIGGTPISSLMENDSIPSTEVEVSIIPDDGQTQSSAATIMRFGMLGALEAYKSGTGGDDSLGGNPFEFGIDVLDGAILQSYIESEFNQRDYRFSESGLFIAKRDPVFPTAPHNPNPETAQAIVAEVDVNGAKTLLLSFRGTDSHDTSFYESGNEAFFGAQAFGDGGNFSHYDSFEPLIEAAYRYARSELNDISNIIVSGHSLGGTMADIFAISDSERFRALEGIETSVVSIGSAGFDPDVIEHLSRINSNVVTGIDENLIFHDEVTELSPPDWYYGVSHSLDRVTFPETDGIGFTQELFRGLAPNSALHSNTGFHKFDGTLQIVLPNHDNEDVFYNADSRFFRGFGLQHNSNLYFNNIQALHDSELAPHYHDEMNIIMGHGRSFFGAQWSDATAHDDGVLYGALNGGATDDFLLGLEGNDLILGYHGADLLDGGVGNDTLKGGRDSDILSGGEGLDNLDGGVGEDSLYGGADRDWLNGQAGNDILLGGEGHDRLIGRAGNDTLNGGLDRDVLEGGTGADTFVFESDAALDVITDFEIGVDLIDVSALGLSFGDIRIKDTPLGALVLFDPDDGRLNGVTLNGVLAAELRPESFIGAPHLAIVGTSDNDVLRGTFEDDELQGLGGNDSIYGLAGSDVMIGGLGNDRYFVDDEGDVVTELAGEGNDQVTTSVDFTLAANVENLNTNTTNSVNLTGNDLGNILNGNNAENTLAGLSGDDYLLGKSGEDVLIGGTGTDLLRGGSDADTFIFTIGDGTDLIIDFEIGIDTIDLSATDLTFDDLTIQNAGAHALITYGTDLIIALHTSSAQLDQDQFLFETPDVPIVDPSLEISASPRILRRGESTTLTWASEGMTDCSVFRNGSELFEGLSGSEELTVDALTSYTLSCTDGIDEYTASGRILVLPEIFET